MFPNKRTAWCGLAAVFVLGACGSGAENVADEASTAEAVAVETDTEQAAVDDGADDVAPAAEASPETATTAPPLTLPVPAADGEGSAQPDGGEDEETSSTTSTDPDAATTQPPTTTAPTTAAPTTAAPSTAAPTTAAPTTNAPSVNLFPDVSVVNVADRQTVSMAARLGGGDRPVLLWFWTPF